MTEVSIDNAIGMWIRDIPYVLTRGTSEHKINRTYIIRSNNVKNSFINDPDCKPYFLIDGLKSPVKLNGTLCMNGCLISPPGPTLTYNTVYRLANVELPTTEKIKNFAKNIIERSTSVKQQTKEEIEKELMETRIHPVDKAVDIVYLTQMIPKMSYAVTVRLPSTPVLSCEDNKSMAYKENIVNDKLLEKSKRYYVVPVLFKLTSDIGYTNLMIVDKIEKVIYRCDPVAEQDKTVRKLEDECKDLHDNFKVKLLPNKYLQYPVKRLYGIFTYEQMASDAKYRHSWCMVMLKNLLQKPWLSPSKLCSELKKSVLQKYKTPEIFADEFFKEFVKNAGAYNCVKEDDEEKCSEKIAEEYKSVVKKLQSILGDNESIVEEYDEKMAEKSKELIQAIQERKPIERISKLISCADVNVKVGIQSPLTASIVSDNLKAFELLLKDNADISDLTKNDSVLSKLVSTKDSKFMVKLLELRSSDMIKMGKGVSSGIMKKLSSVWEYLMSAKGIAAASIPLLMIIYAVSNIWGIQLPGGQYLFTLGVSMGIPNAYASLKSKIFSGSIPEGQQIGSTFDLGLKEPDSVLRDEGQQIGPTIELFPQADVPVTTGPITGKSDLTAPQANVPVTTGPVDGRQDIGNVQDLGLLPDHPTNMTGTTQKQYGEAFDLGLRQNDPTYLQSAGDYARSIVGF